MSLLVEWPHLSLLLTEPIYVLPEPISVPEIKLAEAVKTPVAAPVSIPPAPAISIVPKVNAPKKPRNKVAVFYNEQTTPYLQPQHETLLKNILKSINLTLDNVDLLNLHNIRRLDYADLLREKSVHYFISFGLDLRELEITIPLTAYQPTEVEGVQLLLADSFHELELNLDKKRLLWTCLKQMFR